eukprot:10620859-Lingulodinium_polyedra.AAC.1
MRLPAKKRVTSALELERQGRAPWARAGDLRSLPGSWAWGALLRRGVSCIPAAFFGFLDKHDGCWAVPWAS